jgi:hypothetical protein
MRYKQIKLNFRKVAHLEPKKLQVHECQCKQAPLCHDYFIPTQEGQVECLLCTRFKSQSPPR